MKLAYLETFRARGRMVAYYRRDGFRRRLLGDDGTPVDPADTTALVSAWQRTHEAHEAAQRAAADAAAARAVRPHSIADLIQKYRASDEWAEKAPETKRDYEKALAPLVRDWGKLLVDGLRRQHVAQIRGRYAWREVAVRGGADGATERVWNGRQANRVITVLSILMTFAVDALGWRADNPALRPKRLKTGGEGFRPWRPEEFTQFYERANEEWRFAALLALLTAQRGQDQVKMRWADYDGAGIHVVQLKGNATVKLWVPCQPALRAELDRRRDARQQAMGGSTIAALTILTRPDETPWIANAFQKAAGQAIRAAGLDGLVWHGLRGAAASWAADGGASEQGIQALLGHRTATASRHYARGADQKRLAASTAEAIVLPIKNAAGPATAKRKGARTAKRAS
ncbi:MAG: tyrosine-type recombinase/integrase [Acetobacteraceae bacterium]